jgi:hypothetical protein
MLRPENLRQFRADGWTRVRSAAPANLCARLVEVLIRDLGVPVNDLSHWDEYGGEMRDLIPIWGHQAQWDIRQHPAMHEIWSRLWGAPELRASLDSCRFTPPWKPGHAGEGPMHWDHDPWDEAFAMIQGVLALTDTAADQGGFRCAPSLYRNRDQWPAEPTRLSDGTAEWLAPAGDEAIEHVSAEAGDLIVWDFRLPHSNSRNLSARPRLAFYLLMAPARDDAMRAENVESWRSGRCVSWWRDRPGYDRVEPWPPAKLTPLGRRLLGADDW